VASQSLKTASRDSSHLISDHDNGKLNLMFSSK